jgi:putative inorganic carbon (HCO3(-)) transporter
VRIGVSASFVGVALSLVVAVAVVGSTFALTLTSSSSAGLLALIAVLGVFFMIIVGAPRKILIAALIIDVPLQWDFNIDHNDAAASLGALGGLDISITTFALGGLFALAFLDVTSRRRDEEVRHNDVGKYPILFFLSFVLLTALSIAVADNRELAFFEIVLLFQTLVLFLYIAHALRTRRDISFVLGVLVVSLLLEATIMLAQRYAGFDLSIAGLSTATSLGTLGDERIGGTLGSPNAAGSFLALLLVPTLSLLRTPVSALLRRVALAAFLVGTVALVSTSSRGAWLAFVVSLAVFLGAALRRGWLGPKVPLALVAVLVVVVIPLYGTISSRLEANDRGSAESRVPLMHLAGDMVEQNPLLGIGANNFTVQIPNYAGPTFSRDWIYTVHNKFFLIAAEAGIPALLAFVLFLFAIINVGMRAGKSRDPLLGPIALGITAGIVGQIAPMVVEPFHSRSETQGLALMAAVLIAVARLAQVAEEPVEESTPVSLADARPPAHALGRERVRH